MVFLCLFEVFKYPTKICLVVCSLNSNKQTGFLITPSKPPLVKSVSATVVSGFIHFRIPLTLHSLCTEWATENGLNTYIHEYVNSTIMLWCLMNLTFAFSQSDNSSITANVIIVNIVHPKMTILISYTLITFKAWLIFICGNQMKIFWKTPGTEFCFPLKKVSHIGLEQHNGE